MTALRRRVGSGLLATVLVLALVGCQPPGRPGFDQQAATYAAGVVERGFIVMLNREPSASDQAYWEPQTVEAGQATWFASAMAASAEYRQGLNGLDNRSFVTEAFRRTLGRVPSDDEQALWMQFLVDRPTGRVEMLVWLIENGFTYRLAPPEPASGCQRFDRTGLRPVCAIGSAGDQKGVSIAKVSGTNIYVNKAWLVEMDGFVREARTQGFDLQGERDPAVPAWMFSPGSWRSWDDQYWLYTHINPATGKLYPANPPGRSMHEWGLAVDFDCNGQSITKLEPCWDWPRANGPRHGIYLFHTVDAPTDSETWHFSSNGE